MEFCNKALPGNRNCTRTAGHAGGCSGEPLLPITKKQPYRGVLCQERISLCEGRVETYCMEPRGHEGPHK